MVVQLLKCTEAKQLNLHFRVQYTRGAMWNRTLCATSPVSLRERKRQI